MIENEVVLKNGRWETHVLPFFGNNVISLKRDGKEILRSPGSLAELKRNSVLFGIPLLFPPNRTKDGAFSFDGRKYHLPINDPSTSNHLHGMMTDAPFRVEIARNSMFACVYENRADTCESRFPFPFIIRILCTLEETGLHQQVEIYNSGTSAMPVLLGFHTAFMEPERFSVPVGQRWETDSRYIPTGKLLELTPREQSYRNGYSPTGKVISGFFTTVGHTAQIGDIYYHASDNFTQWILYNGKGNEGFFCAEPQSGPVNGLNMPQGATRLEAGERVIFRCRISDDCQQQ